jgi:hypothetical protein
LRKKLHVSLHKRVLLFFPSTKLRYVQGFFPIIFFKNLDSYCDAYEKQDACAIKELTSVFKKIASKAAVSLFTRFPEFGLRESPLHLLSSLFVFGATAAVAAAATLAAAAAAADKTRAARSSR